MSRILVLGGALCCLAVVPGCGKPSQAEIDRDNLFTVTYRCKEAIKERLRDPGSVVFESDDARAVPGGWVVKVGFRAKNGFGGYNKASQACVVDSGGTVQAVLDDK